ncbi:hypothetical protein J6590_085795 [Homalodisca vitripennis]|nr:hypothetical protein J6590_085795 [Homalodisca vitripennis]
MAKELRKDSITKVENSQPGKEPDWSFDELAEELEQLTDPIVVAVEETPEWIGALQEEVDSINPPEGAAGTSSVAMEPDRGASPKPTLLDLASVTCGRR